MVALVGVVGVPAAVRGFYADSYMRPKYEVAHDVYPILYAAAIRISKKRRVDIDDLAITAFRVEPGRPLRFRRRLDRLARLRAAEGVPPSDVVWTRGKGVIGKCWADGRQEVYELNRAYAKWYPQGRHRWKVAPPNVRMNMSWDEMCEVNGKYGAVLPTQIKDRHGRVVGILAVDVPEGKGDVLRGEWIKKETRATALILGRLIR